MRKHGVLSFHFVGDPTILEVHVFVVPDFAGELQESEEMAPQWFALDADLYVGEASFVRVEAEYEGLITNRIILTPSLELDTPLGDDEALIIETTTPVQPAFLGFHLANLWGESLDFESYPSNINAHFMEPDPDGSWRWVVSHKDPGVANWVSTTGIPHGYTSMRWTYPEPPPKEQWPTLSCKKVAFSEIENALPHARKVTEDERAAQRLIRHRHVQRRYRQY